MKAQAPTLLVAVALAVASISCSTNQLLSDALSNALGEQSDGEHPLLAENDPDLVREALPFTLKLLDILIAQDISSPSILLTTSQAYTANAALFLQQEANTTARFDYERRPLLLDRSKIHYLRGRDYALDALQLINEGFDRDAGVFAAFEQSLDGFTEEQVAYLYWAGVAWFGAIAIDTFDIALAVTANKAKALIDRAYVLDPDYNNGAIDEFYILYYGSLPAALGGDIELAKYHYERVLMLSDNGSASAHISYGSALSVQSQDAPTFVEYMNKALEVDVDKNPNSRLANIVAQRQAQWNLDNLEVFFIEVPELL